jgi:hypothetical protein
VCLLDFIFRFADDYLLLATSNRDGRRALKILRFFLLASILGIPLKWKKTRGGFRSEFIGYLFLWDSLQGGLSERRTDWLCNWADNAAKAGIVEARELRSALGRFAFSGTLLRFLLPFLGPLYSWAALLPDGAAWPLPAALIIILRWISKKIRSKPLVGLKHPVVINSKVNFKADAKAEGDSVVVGGFESVDGVDLSLSRWFSVTLSPTTAPWAFVKHGEAYRVIAALELFATLLCVMLFAPDNKHEGSVVITMPGVTDNQGNEALIVKNMTSKFPLFLVLMELTEQLQNRRLTVDLAWTPRETNQDADDLTNGKFNKFSPSLRIKPVLDQLPWIIFTTLMPEAIELHNIISEKKDRAKNTASATKPARPLLGGKKKVSKTRKLKVPW